MKKIKLPSQHQIGDDVKLTFGKKCVESTVIAVKFSKTGEVYDLYIMVPEAGSIIKDIDGIFIEKLEK